MSTHARLREAAHDRPAAPREWEATGRALMEHGGNVSAAAKALSVHTNTVYYRLETIRSATGADLRDARALAELELAVLSRDFGVLEVPGE